MDSSELKEAIKKNRPKISDNSISTYVSVLRSLIKKYSKPDDKINLEWFENQDEIIKHLKDVKPNLRKTILSALISITDEKHNEKYKKAMMSDAEAYKSDKLKQEKTPTEEANWISQADISKKILEMLKDTKSLWNKSDLAKSDYQKLQNVILVALTSGYYVPPRRAVDWTNFAVSDIDEKNDNYLDMKKKEFVFNKYKGSTEKGVQRVAVPKQLLVLLKKFLKLNKHKWLLVDSQNKQLNSVKLAQHLNRIWGKNASVNVMRHSWISHKYPVVNVAEMKQDAKDMGSSVNQFLETYIKKE